jgi:transcriptional regulator with XRE-family HTH domain
MEQADLHLAHRLKQLRLAQDWSLDQLAANSSLSRATLSRMENAEVSPTAQTLGKLCAAYGLTMSHLLYMVEQSLPAKLTAAQQPVWRDAKTGFTRRSVIPPSKGFAGEMVLCELKPGADIGYDQLPREGIEHYIYLTSGSLTFAVKGEAYSLSEGDSLRLKLFGQTRFTTPANQGATYILFVV